jgi:hypothetical protein
MSNANTVLGGYAGWGTLRNQFPVQTVATATETALVVNTDTGTATALVTVPTGGQIYGASTAFDANANPAITRRSGREYGNPSGVSNDQFSSNSFNALAFKVRLSGYASLGATQTAIIYLYNGAATVVGTSGNRIALTGAAYPGGGTSTTPSNFLLEFTGLWDPTSEILSGWYTANIANGSTSQFTTTTVITNVQTSVTAAGLTFCAGLKLANTTSSTIQLREFVIEEV